MIKLEDVILIKKVNYVNLRLMSNFCFDYVCKGCYMIKCNRLGVFMLIELWVDFFGKKV